MRPSSRSHDCSTASMIVSHIRLALHQFAHFVKQSLHVNFHPLRFYPFQFLLIMCLLRAQIRLIRVTVLPVIRTLPVNTLLHIVSSKHGLISVKSESAPLRSTPLRHMLIFDLC